ncbi:pyridoxal phosphate-dependent aminotransferase [PVC group bacterium]|nr:pyridoxal phosphate-dependent aminotransferase [PVC group bacterium]
MRLSRRVKDLKPSITLEITAKAKKMRSEGIDIISLSAGEPDFNTPDLVKEAAKQAIDDNFTRYTPAAGILELRKGVAEKLKRDNDLEYSPECISLCSGAKHAIYNVIQVLCDPNDEVLIPAPYWVSYPEMVLLASAKPVIIPTTESMNFKITPDLLEKYVTKKSKILILNSPSNPTGMVYSGEELKALSEFVCKNDLIVISDEIYEKLIYDGEHVSIASFHDEIKQRTVVVNGFSKSHAMTGWRVGYTAARIEIAQAMNNLLSQSTSNVSSITQKASLAALLVEESVIRNMRNEFLKRRDLIVDRLNNIAGVTCLKPEGAFYVFPNIKNLQRGPSMTVANALLDQAEVAVVPGIGFGADENIRLSYACSAEDITEGLNRFEAWATPPS